MQPRGPPGSVPPGQQQPGQFPPPTGFMPPPPAGMMFPPPHMQFPMPMQYPGNFLHRFYYCLCFLPLILVSLYLCDDLNKGGPPMGMPMPGHPPHMQQYPPHMAMPGMPGRGPLPGEFVHHCFSTYCLFFYIMYRQ